MMRKCHLNTCPVGIATQVRVRATLTLTLTLILTLTPSIATLTPP